MDFCRCFLAFLIVAEKNSILLYMLDYEDGKKYSILIIMPRNHFSLFGFLLLTFESFHLFQRLLHRSELLSNLSSCCQFCLVPHQTESINLILSLLDAFS